MELYGVGPDYFEKTGDVGQRTTECGGTGGAGWILGGEGEASSGERSHQGEGGHHRSEQSRQTFGR